MIADDFLWQDCCYLINKKLIKIFWFQKALFITALIDKRKQCWTELFNFTQDEIEKELWIERHTQTNYTNEFVSLWILSKEKKWLPAKNLFRINDNKLLKSMCEEKIQEVPQMEKFLPSSRRKENTVQTTDGKKIGDYIYNNNIYTFTQIYSMLWNEIPTWASGWDEKLWEKVFKDKLQKWFSVDEMMKSASLAKFELRERVWDFVFTKKKENWLRDLCHQDDDTIELRIIEILKARLKRYNDWVKFKSNTVAELSEIFWTEYINWLWRQIQKEEKQHF